MALGAIGDFMNTGGGVSGYISLAIWGIVAMCVIAMCGFFLYYTVIRKKNWNLRVEIKIIRSDGKLVISEWGKGNYDLKRGVVWIKRDKQKPIAMKPFDTEKYLQGNSKGQNILTVVQVSPGHYEPLLLESFLSMHDESTGEEAQFAKVKSDFAESRSWKNQFERDAKDAYTIMNLLKEYASYIGIGIVLFMNFAGFAILYAKVS